MTYTIEQIAEIVDGLVVQSHDKPIGHFITDSRSVNQHPDSIFVALKGPNHDGHKFIPDLIGKGLKSFLVEQTFDTSGLVSEIGIIKVDDTLAGFHKLAAFHRQRFTGEVVAISGSNGKTVVKEWLSQLLAKKFSVAKSPKSYNSQAGVPISVMMMNPGPDYHILEAGISHPGEMEKLEDILKPDIGILTNLGEAHQENFISSGEKLNEKLKLFSGAKCLFINLNSIIIKEGVEKFFAASETKVVSWAYSGAADLQVEVISGEIGKTIISGLYKKEEYRLEIPFTDSASIENIVSIWLFWLHNEYDTEIFQIGVDMLEPVAMRLEQKEGLRGCHLINDYYNADFHSLSIALDLLINQLPQEKKTLIVSDLLQTGLDDGELIARLSSLLRDRSLHRVVGIGSLLYENASSFDVEIEVFPDTDSFLQQFNLALFKDEAILLKGARKFKFEKISRRLEKQFHNTFVEVNMVALLHNLNVYRSYLSEETKLMAMVKASSYGSGTHEVAKLLANQRVDYLGVAFVDEGIQLRDAGINVPIMVMNTGPESMESLLENRLEPEIFSFDVLKEFYHVALLAGEKQYPIHIKIDTGMHRLGFQKDEVDDLISFIENQDVIKIQSVFSHLAAADASDEFTHKQARTLRSIIKRIEDRVGKTFITHLVNSTGIVKFPEYHFDMVRLGIGMYGIDPAGQLNLKSVISFKSTITQIHQLKKGEAVGYGNSELLKSDGEIAVIPVGYADGFDRRFSLGVGSVLCNGKVAKVIGKVCMDMTMIDITGIEASVGDQVTIIGDDLSLNEVAKKIDTIPYEILTSIPQRVRRIYLFE